MKTRMIYPTFWKDNYISELSSKEKLVFIYLLTNDCVNICGIYQLPDKYIRAECDLTTPEFETMKAKFAHDNKFSFHNGWVKVVNYDKYNKYTGESNEKARESELKLVPDILKGNKTPSLHPVDRELETSNTLSNKSVLNKERESAERENKITPLKDFITFFNGKSGKNYRETEGLRKQLKTRLTTYTLDQLKKASSNLLNSSFHTGHDSKRNPDNTWYATPEFILRNDEKVDEWLNKSVTPKPKLHVPEYLNNIPNSA